MNRTLSPLERTRIDLQLGSERDRFSNLDYITHFCVVQEAFQVKDQYRWQRLDQDLLVCVHRYAWSCWRGHSDWLRVRDALKSLSNRVDLFTLQRMLVGDARWLFRFHGGEPGCRVVVLSSSPRLRSPCVVAREA